MSQPYSSAATKIGSANFRTKNSEYCSSAEERSAELASKNPKAHFLDNQGGGEEMGGEEEEGGGGGLVYK